MLRPPDIGHTCGFRHGVQGRQSNTGNRGASMGAVWAVALRATQQFEVSPFRHLSRTIQRSRFTFPALIQHSPITHQAAIHTRSGAPFDGRTSRSHLAHSRSLAPLPLRVAPRRYWSLLGRVGTVTMRRSAPRKLRQLPRPSSFLGTGAETTARRTSTILGRVPPKRFLSLLVRADGESP